MKKIFILTFLLLAQVSFVSCSGSEHSQSALHYGNDLVEFLVKCPKGSFLYDWGEGSPDDSILYSLPVDPNTVRIKLKEDYFPDSNVNINFALEGGDGSLLNSFERSFSESVRVVFETSELREAVAGLVGDVLKEVADKVKPEFKDLNRATVNKALSGFFENHANLLHGEVHKVIIANKLLNAIKVVYPSLDFRVASRKS